MYQSTDEICVAASDSIQYGNMFIKMTSAVLIAVILMIDKDGKIEEIEQIMEV